MVLKSGDLAWWKVRKHHKQIQVRFEPPKKEELEQSTPATVYGKKFWPQIQQARMSCVFLLCFFATFNHDTYHISRIKAGVISPPDLTLHNLETGR